MLDGRFDALGVSHELTVGTSAQRRTLDQRPGYNEWRGTGNIHTVRLDEKTWDQNGVAGRHTRQYQLLPNAALIYKPQPDTTL
ncbi:hypothetical protein WR25_20944 [Diploscapter pachys]|uniref:Uncharacterized protein n=1 Tax=Diploscapter pachys TaxID=2018661 RepID=A0A2A2KCI0_9BILA|nr:hypothetical protein WR25_20944 [Diploscapter pachys]